MSSLATAHRSAPSRPNAATFNVWVDVVGRFATQAFAIADAEWRKLARDPTELFTRAVQPALWLVVFGQVFTRLHAIPTGSLGYVAFMAPGVLAQSVLFSAIFYGIAVIWERDLGITHKMLVSPASRVAIVVGKGLAAAARGLVQGLIVSVLAVMLGVAIRVDVVSVTLLVAIVVLASMLFSTFSLIIACLVKTRERFMGVGQLLTMPLFFASNAIYPLAVMPHWLATISRVNPLTYVVDALRALMIQGGQSTMGLGVDVAVLVAVTLAFIATAARLLPVLVR
jgi:ABC-2 type transport system permease protein